MPLEAGTRLGPYEIVQVLAAGGMGEVYRARDPRLARDVAIKVLAPHLAQDRDALARFEREAKTASALNHPHIVHIYEIGQAPTSSGPVHYIAMELVEGETLRARLKAGARIKTLLEPLAQAADALARAHKEGIVHRDLKPENVMITADGYPKVLDFGLAKLHEPAEPAGDAGSQPTPALAGHTRTGTILGTPGYMSPEQVQAKPVDHRSDVFSFGCILYEAATGRQPFRGDTSVATLHAIVYDEPPPVETLTPETPEELRRIVRRCLEKIPERRYQAMKDVADDLRRVARGGTTPSPDELSTRAFSGVARPRWRLGHWLAAGGLAIAALLGAAAGAQRGCRARSGGAAGTLTLATESLDFAGFAREFWRRELVRPQAHVSFHKPEGDLQDLMRTIADACDCNLLVAPGVGGRVAARFQDLPWPEVLSAAIAEQERELAWFLAENVVVVWRSDDLRSIWGTDLLLLPVSREASDRVLATVRPNLSRAGRCATTPLSRELGYVIVDDFPLHVEYVARLLGRLGVAAEPVVVTLNRAGCTEPQLDPSAHRRPLHVRFRSGGLLGSTKPVSIDFSAADARQALYAFSQAAGTSLRLGRGVGGPLTLKLRDLPPGMLLHVLVSLNRWDYACDGGVLSVFQPSDAGRYSTSRVFPLAAPLKASELRLPLATTLLDRDATLETLAAGNALRFVGRPATGRRLSLALQHLSTLSEAAPDPRGR